MLLFRDDRYALDTKVANRFFFYEIFGCACGRVSAGCIRVMIL